MITQQIAQQIDLWEAWIEYNPDSTTHFGQLYLMGEIQTLQKSTHPFFIKDEQAGTGSELVLFIPSNSGYGRGRIKEVIYSEPILNLNQYRSIRILAGEEVVAVIKDIEVLV